MPKEGFEPSWVYTHYALNVARLPIPPLRLTKVILSGFLDLSTLFNFFAIILMKHQGHGQGQACKTRFKKS